MNITGNSSVRTAELKSMHGWAFMIMSTGRPVCTENYIRVYQVTESAKLAQW